MFRRRSPPDNRPRVLLICSIDATGLSRLPDLFHRAGYRVTVLTRYGTAIVTSRFVQDCILVSGGPAEVAAELAGRIGELANSFALLLPCDEPLLEALAERSDLPAISAAMPFLPPPEMLSLVLSKLAFLKAAREAGLPVPEFAICQDGDQVADSARLFGYPVVLKRARSMAGSGVRIVGSEAELRVEMTGFGEQEYLVQRFVKGRIGGTTIFMERGVPVRFFSFYKLHNWPTPEAPSGGGELVESPQIRPLLEKIGQLSGFRGLCSIDWLEETGTGRIWLIEFNPRYTPSTYKSAWAGSDFIPVLRGMHAREEAVVPLVPAGRAGRRFCMFPEAALRAIDDRNPWLLLRSLRSAPWHDPRLLLAQARRVLTYYIPGKWKTGTARLLLLGDRRQKPRPRSE